MEKYRLCHFVILDQDVRALLVSKVTVTNTYLLMSTLITTLTSFLDLFLTALQINIYQPLSDIIKKLCTTFGTDMYSLQRDCHCCIHF